MKRQIAPALAAGFVALFGLAMLGAAFVDTDLFKAMGYALVNIVVGLAGYYFGTSQSSARKDAVIAAQLKGPAKDG